MKTLFLEEVATRKKVALTSLSKEATSRIECILGGGFERLFGSYFSINGLKTEINAEKTKSSRNL